jgi:cyanoexosortase A
MGAIAMLSLKRLQEPTFWLVGMLSAIAAIHLTLIYRADDTDLLATSLLFWTTAGSLLWERRQKIHLKSGPGATLGGILLLVVFLLRSTALPGADGTLKIMPLVALVGVGLMASGWNGLRQYWRELLIFALLALYPLLEHLLQLINLPQLTAKAAMFMLWYSGFEVQRQGLFLMLPSGRVEVYGACSGVHSILQMLSVGVLFLLLFPVASRMQKCLCLMVAVGIGFLVNAARVALLAVLVAFAQKPTFEYWHGGSGSLVFSVISVAIFGAFCWFAYLRSPKQQSDPGASHE